MYVLAELLKAVTGHLAGNVRYSEGLISGPIVNQCWELMDTHKDAQWEFHFIFSLHVSKHEAAEFAADKFV